MNPLAAKVHLWMYHIALSRSINDYNKCQMLFHSLRQYLSNTVMEVRLQATKCACGLASYLFLCCFLPTKSIKNNRDTMLSGDKSPHTPCGKQGFIERYCSLRPIIYGPPLRFTPSTGFTCGGLCLVAPRNIVDGVLPWVLLVFRLRRKTNKTHQNRVARGRRPFALLWVKPVEGSLNRYSPVLCYPLLAHGKKMHARACHSFGLGFLDVVEKQETPPVCEGTWFPHTPTGDTH